MEVAYGCPLEQLGKTAGTYDLRQPGLAARPRVRGIIDQGTEHAYALKSQHDGDAICA